MEGGPRSGAHVEKPGLADSISDELWNVSEAVTTGSTTNADGRE